MFRNSSKLLGQMDPSQRTRYRAIHTKSGRLILHRALFDFLWLNRKPIGWTALAFLGIPLIFSPLLDWFGRDWGRSMHEDRMHQIEILEANPTVKSGSYVSNNYRAQPDPDFNTGSMMNPAAEGVGIKELSGEHRSKLFREDIYKKSGVLYEKKYTSANNAYSTD